MGNYQNLQTVIHASRMSATVSSAISTYLIEIRILQLLADLPLSIQQVLSCSLML